MTEVGAGRRVVDGVATAWFDAPSLTEGAVLAGASWSLALPSQVGRTRLAAALTAGGRLLDESRGRWRVADPEGNELVVGGVDPWQHRENVSVTTGMPPTDAATLSAWCTDQLGSAVEAELFRSTHLSTVVGVRLADGREVVVKVRLPAARIAGCVEVQRRMSQAGYPCPAPLAGPAPFGASTATAEVYVPGGASAPSTERAAQLSASAFARLIRSAPGPEEVSSLEPPPSWAAWDHGGHGLWPRPDGADVDLNAVDGPAWLDRVAARARDRLGAGRGETVIGHCDWLGDNVRWLGDELLVVHDWDSAVADTEPVLVGLAAALYSTVDSDDLPTVEQTDRFLAAYGEARGRALTADEVERAWAAGIWTRACDAKEQHVAGLRITSLARTDAEARLRRAGIS